MELKLTNKAGRQIGIPGEPALILDKDESVFVSADQMKEYFKHPMVVRWLDEGAIVFTAGRVKLQYKGKAERMASRYAADWRKREMEERTDKARAKYAARIKAAAKRKRKPKILMSREPKLIPSRPLNAAEAARKYNAEEKERAHWADSFDKTDIVSRRDCENDSDKTDIVSSEGTWPCSPIDHVPKNGPINEFGHTSTGTFGEQHVPNEILAEAIRNDACVGVDRLALGKPYGNIINPDHWMYDEGRDYFMSLPVFENSAMHPWNYEIWYPHRPELVPAGFF